MLREEETLREANVSHGTIVHLCLGSGVQLAPSFGARSVAADGNLITGSGSASNNVKMNTIFVLSVFV